MVSDCTVSTVNILFTLAVAEFVRIQFLASGNKYGTIQRCFQEFIAVFELCVVIEELGIILESNGIWIFMIYVCVVFFWFNLRWTNATAAPFKVLDDILIGSLDTDFFAFVFIIMAGFAGGAVYYHPYLSRLWQLWDHTSIGVGPIHKAELASPLSCSSSIKTQVVLAAVIEGSGVFVLRLLENIMSVDRTWNEYLAAGIKAVATTACIIGALHFTGGYFNPYLASALQNGCSGITGLQLVYVYWTGPLIGSLLLHVIWFYTPFRNLFNTRFE